MTAVTGGRQGVLHLLRRYILWRVPFRWYLVALLGIPALLILSSFLAPGGSSAFHAPTATFLLTYLVVFIPMSIFGGPLGEEPGWRGFAFPRLQRLHGPQVGTLILGVLWWL
jgi:CAAX protease family protein